MSGSQVNLYMTLVELIRFDKNDGVNLIHSHTIENSLALHGEKNRSYWKILRDINHTLNNNSYCVVQTSLTISEWFLFLLQ